MARITVQRQCWQRWPRVLIAERHNDDGTVDERRYVPEGGTRDEWNERTREVMRKYAEAANNLNARLLEEEKVPNLQAEVDGLKWQVEELEAALRKACEFIADYGSCPYDAFDLYEPWEESCYQKCSADVDRAECWRRYFERGGHEGRPGGAEGAVRPRDA